MGLICLAMLPSTAGMVKAASLVLGAPVTPAVASWVAVARLLGAVVTSAWLVSAVATRVLRTADVLPRTRARRMLVPAACGAVAVVTSLPGARAGAFGAAAYGVVLAWLALEVTASHGVGLDMSLDVGSTAARASAWRQTTHTVAACVAGGALTTGSAMLIRLVGAGDAVPVMKSDQLTALGIDSLGTLLLNVVFAVTVEDIVIVAGASTLLQAARWPTWLIYTVICSAEVLIHPYLGLPALGMAVYAAWRVKIFRRHGRVLPLVLGHGFFDIVGALLMPLTLTARVITLLPIGAGFAVAGHLLTRASESAQAVPAPMKEPS